MRLALFDPKIKRSLRRYLLQVTIATVALIAVLVAEQILTGQAAARAVLVAAVASTSFILFISPYSLSARPKHVIGGHMLALIISLPLAYLASTSLGTEWIGSSQTAFAVYAALGVGATMFIMAATNTEHAPAASTALGVVVHGFDWNLIVFVVSAVLILVGIHQVLRHRLTDLY